jgi:hypothetical protein
MKSIIRAAVLVSVSTVAIAQQSPTWNLTGGWQCVQGCDPSANPRHITQDGADITFIVPNTSVGHVRWMGLHRMLVPEWNQFVDVESSSTMFVEDNGGVLVSRWEKR